VGLIEWVRAKKGKKGRGEEWQRKEWGYAMEFKPSTIILL
jgi:hypothetical protein